MVVDRMIGEETVILNLDTESYYGLDPVGTRLWELISEKGDLKAVFEIARAEYEVAPAELERDLLSLTEELVAQGLLIRVGG